MGRSLIGFLLAGALFTTMGAVVTANDSENDATQTDEVRIQGTWRIIALDTDAESVADGAVGKIAVVNGADGTWTLVADGKEINKGTSTFDSTHQPKTIDFTVTDGDGKGDRYLGIYELGETTRKVCFAPPGKERPTEFSISPGSKNVLVVFEREKVLAE